MLSVTDPAPVLATQEPLPGSASDAFGALVRARDGAGSVVMVRARSGALLPTAVLDAVAARARIEGWGVARAEGAELDRARPLALVRRLAVAAGGIPAATDSVRLAAARLERVGIALARDAPAGLALLVVADAHLASRACLRTLRALADGIEDLPIVLVLGLDEPRPELERPPEIPLREPTGL